MEPLQLVIFDWTGTTVDFGGFAPVTALVQAFAQHGVEVSPDEARTPQGLYRKEQVRALLRSEDVATRWRQAHRRFPGEADAEALCTAFAPLLLETVEAHSRLVPGLLECVEELRRHGVRVGAMTGYPHAAAERIYQSARDQGYAPDACADDADSGRPGSALVLRVMEALGVTVPAAVVTIGDTAPDVAAGRGAGTWCVGMLRSSSAVGLTEQELAGLPRPERLGRLAIAGSKLYDAGAHAVVETFAELPAVLAYLAGRLRAGEAP